VGSHYFMSRSNLPCLLQLNLDRSILSLEDNDVQICDLSSLWQPLYGDVHVMAGPAPAGGVWTCS
jgi:hypothetical protein